MSAETKAGIFVAGATGTRYAGRPIKDAMRSAYNGNAEFVSSSLLSSDPPKDSQLVNLLQANSGKQADIFVHSSGGAQFKRALKQTKGEVDMSNMTVVAIDIPKSPGNLRRGLKVVGGEATKAIDSVTAFHPDSSTISLEDATAGLRQVFSKLAQNGSGLRTIDYQRENPIDYSASLTDQKREKVATLDELIASTLTDQNLSDAREFFVQRGILLHEDKESIYRGDSPLLRSPDANKGEIKREKSLADHIQSARIFPTVASGSAWMLMGELEQQYERGQGPRVVTVIPEWGPYVSRTDAEAIYPSRSIAKENMIFLPSLSHSGLALQPQVIGEIKKKLA